MGVEAVDIRNWVATIVLGMITLRIAGQILKSAEATSAKQALTHTALVNGLILGLGLSPNVTAAEALVSTAPALDYRATGFIGSLVDVATVVDIVVGLIWTYEKGRLLTVVAFILAFIGGYVLPITPAFGVVLWGGATLVSLASPNTGF